MARYDRRTTYSVSFFVLRRRRQFPIFCHHRSRVVCQVLNASVCVCVCGCEYTEFGKQAIDHYDQAK